MIKKILYKIYEYLLSYQLLQNEIYNYENYIVMRPRI